MAEMNEEDFDEDIQNIKRVMSEYSRKNIYNMDETGLVFKNMPKTTISTRTIKGNKKLLERITLVCCVNAVGENLPLTIIGKSKNPRCFKNFNVNDYCIYNHSSKAWMNEIIWCEYLDRLNQQMKSKNIQILLLADNCPAHKMKTFSNVKLLFLPKNTTGLFQPLDKGIIKAFKTYYSKLLFTKVIEKTTANESFYKAYKGINVKDAIVMSSIAWDQVSTNTIQNCWCNSKLIDSKEETHVNDLSVVENEILQDAKYVFDKTFNIEELVDLNNYDEQETLIPDEELVEEILNVEEELNVDFKTGMKHAFLAVRGVSTNVFGKQKSPGYAGYTVVQFSSTKNSIY